MKKKIGNIRKAGVMLGVIGIVFSIVMFMSVNDAVVDNPVVKSVGRVGPFQLVAMGDADPGSGASGVLEVFVNATGDSNYTTNVTGPYAVGEVNNSHIGSDTPYATGVDVGVKVRWNKTHAYDTDWNLSLVRAYANSTVLSVTAIQMEELLVTDGTSSDFITVIYWLSDSDGGAGTGFTITEGQNVTGFSINFESLFYP